MRLQPEAVLPEASEIAAPQWTPPPDRAQDSGPASPAVALPSSRQVAEQVSPSPESDGAEDPPDAPPRERTAPSSRLPTTADAREPTTSPNASQSWTLDVRPRPTDWGGLFFLVFALRRLGLAECLQQQPDLSDAAFGARILSRVADRLEIEAEDPIRAPLDHPFRPDEGLDGLVLTWIESLEDWLAEHVELTLEEVVRRSAAVTCTRTHVDVVFDMESSEVAIRRAGLDIDPGWVPWLGRVVSFHYVFGGMLDG